MINHFIIFHALSKIIKNKTLFIFSLSTLLFSLSTKAQTTVTICNGDSAFLYNNWETQNGIYTDNITSTTLIVNPTPTLTGSFVLNGNATQPIPNTYNLTQAIGNQSGSAWNSVTLNLTQPFIFDVDMFFGNNNGGADGIAFLLQQVSTSVGTSGGGIGYQGISPSLGVEFDTWQNSQYTDPAYDHLAVQRNGDLNHSGANNLVPATSFPPGNSNIEDGIWHNVIFSWDPTTFNFQVTFDGALLVNYNNNIVASVFGNNPNVYWGFTAATGGANNLQRFRVNSLGVQLSDITICQDDSVQIDPQVNSSTYTYLWTPNYNITNNTSSTSFFSPDTTTLYFLEVTNSYNCSFTDSLTVFVNAATSNTISLDACNSYTWSTNGNTYTTSGTYTNISTNATGCTHTDTLNLTINNSTSNTNTATACDAYTWPLNGNSYNTSGIYTAISTNTDNCTHLDSLYLTINYSNIGFSTDTACETYTWEGQTITVSGDLVHTYVGGNTDGCDSTHTISITINNATSNTANVIACDSYTWILNGNTYNASGTYIDISTNSAGCTHTEILDLLIGYTDSLDLIIDKSDIDCFGYNNGSITLNITGGEPPYQFLWNSGSLSQSIISLSTGNYAFTITDNYSCQLDSFAIINEANEVTLDFIATTPICRYDESTLSINISNSIFNTYTILLLDSVLKSFVIDTNGVLIAEEAPITLTPNFSGEVFIQTITDNEGCTTIFNDDVHIEVKQLPQLAINEDDICVGEPSYNLNNATPTGGTYFINNIMTNYFDVENLEPEGYNIKYIYTDPITSCTNEIIEVVNINESPKPKFLFSPQPTNIDNPNILFRDNSNEEFLLSEWHLGDSTIIYDELSFWHTYANTGTYTIKYYTTNIYGCTDSTTNYLTINPIYSIFTPNAFTPNNDGNNDYFHPIIIGYNNFNMKIYDRWGEMIYNEDNGKWDGTINKNIVPNGIYSYSISVFDFNNRLFIYTGTINLLK